MILTDKDVELILRQGRRCNYANDDAESPANILHQYDQDRGDFIIIFSISVILALSIVVLSVLPFFVKVKDEPQLSPEGVEAFNCHQVCMSISLLILSSFGN